MCVQYGLHKFAYAFARMKRRSNQHARTQTIPFDRVYLWKFHLNYERVHIIHIRILNTFKAHFGCVRVPEDLSIYTSSFIA